MSGVDRVLRNLWESVLGFELRPAKPRRIPDAAESRTPLRADGAGIVVIRCSPALARAAAGAFFRKPPSELGESDVADALRELGNITAGNLRPAVAVGRSRRSFLCGGEALEIEVRS